MCGIAGIVHREAPIREADVHRMDRLLSVLQYRGPDGKGVWNGGNVMLGHRRLSIIDLSSQASQPMHDVTHDLHLTFNGEIYNFRELRGELITRGYSFRTQSDTEVVLAAYLLLGPDWLSRLRGMFALMLVDGRQGRVILARDRMGKKPLYYYLSHDRLIVCSELKGFHVFEDVPLRIDDESVRAFLALQFVPGPYSIYRDITRLQPGTSLVLDQGTWSVSLKQFWSVQQELDALGESPVSLDELDDALVKSVSYRLIADVEVGILLSGGVDSSLIAHAARASSNARLRAFFVSFRDEDLDETPYARRVAAACGLDLVEVEGHHITPGTFEDVVYHADEPLGDPALLPTYMIAQELSRHVKVVLSGEGADELFWGYPHYQLEMHWLRRFGEGFRTDASWIAAIGRGLESVPWVPPVVSRLAKVTAASPNERISKWVSVFGTNSLRDIMPGTSAPSRHLQQFEEAYTQFRTARGPLESSIALDILFWLPDDLLLKVDRMSMAHSVEARAPFLDSALVALAMRMPRDQKADTRQTKKILRELLARRMRWVPRDAIVQRRKHGFETPTAKWLRTDLREVCDAHFEAGNIAHLDMLDAKYVKRLWTDFLAGRASKSYVRKIWLLLCLLEWSSQHRSGFNTGKFNLTGGN